MIGSKQVEIPYYRGVGRHRGRGFRALAQGIGRTAFPFLREYVVQRQNAWVLRCWSLLHQTLQRLLAVEKFSRRLQRVWETKI